MWRIAYDCVNKDRSSLFMGKGRGRIVRTSFQFFNFYKKWGYLLYGAYEN